MNKMVFPFFVLLVVTSGFLILNSSFRNVSEQDETPEKNDMQAVLKTSCYDCHGAGSTNEDALEALNFEKFDELRKVQKITKLKEMAEVVEKREMPPKKYLSKKPHAQLSDEQIKAFVQWSDKEIKQLIGN